jgi:hypothetical protein
MMSEWVEKRMEGEPGGSEKKMNRQVCVYNHPSGHYAFRLNLRHIRTTQIRNLVENRHTGTNSSLIKFIFIISMRSFPTCYNFEIGKRNKVEQKEQQVIQKQTSDVMFLTKLSTQFNPSTPSPGSINIQDIHPSTLLHKKTCLVPKN